LLGNQVLVRVGAIYVLGTDPFTLSGKSRQSLAFALEIAQEILPDKV